MKAQGFGLLTITKDKAPTVLRMVEYNGITHPIVSDTTDPTTGKVFEKYRAYDGKHYLIASDGRIVATFSKLGISLPVLQKVLAKHGIDASAAVAGSKDPASMAPAAASSSSGARSATPGVPVTWKATARPASVATGSAIAVTLSASVAPGWRVYAASQKRGGPEPLAVSLSRSQPFVMTGPVKAPAPIVKFDPNFGMDVETHEDRADFEIPVSTAGAKPGEHTLFVEARYQTCNAVICLPPQTEVVRIPLTVTARK